MVKVLIKALDVVAAAGPVGWMASVVLAVIAVAAFAIYAVTSRVLG